MDSPRHFKYTTPSPRATAAAPIPVYTLPYKRLDPFASVSPASRQQQEPPIDSARSAHSKSNVVAPKSLSAMNFDSSSGGSSNTLYSILPATTSSSPATPKFPIKPQHAHPRTSIAATADFLDALRSRSLLDYKFMREFSLVHRKPVAERSLAKLSASSVYSMRMAQLSLAEQGRSFAGRQQWLLKPEPLEMMTTADSAKSANDELRAPTSTAAQQPQRQPQHHNTARFKRTRTHKPVASADTDAAVSCFPTLWSSGGGANVHFASSGTARGSGAGNWSPPCGSAQPPPVHTVKRAAESATHHGDSSRSSPVQEVSAPQSSTLIWNDLSEFDLRKCHASSAVAQNHGFLTEQDIPVLMAQTGYNRTELYALWARFKALCSISRAPTGIDRDTFHRGIPQLSVEDDFFIDRVFAILDADGSGILEWQEFVEALSALEKGDVAKRVGFLFRVYDLNGDGSIHRSEAREFFLASLLVAATDEVEDVARHFVDKIFAAVGCSDSEPMRVEHAIAYMQAHPATDIYSLFGRTMVSRRQQPPPALASDSSELAGTASKAVDPVASMVG